MKRTIRPIISRNCSRSISNNCQRMWWLSLCTQDGTLRLYSVYYNTQWVDFHPFAEEARGDKGRGSLPSPCRDGLWNHARERIGLQRYKQANQRDQCEAVEEDIAQDVSLMA